MTPRVVRSDPLTLGRVVGDVVDPFDSTVSLSISFNGRNLNNGAEFRPSALANPPRVRLGGDDLRNFYTLVMVNADAPTPTNPTQREYLHWMVTDIPETTTANFGNELVEYESPMPAAGIHRIVFVLFRQPQRTVAQAHEGGRANFSCRRFSEAYGLGPPAAVMYFNCQRERGTGGRRFM